MIDIGHHVAPATLTKHRQLNRASFVITSCHSVSHFFCGIMELLSPDSYICGCSSSHTFCLLLKTHCLSRPSVPPSSSHKFARDGLWLAMHAVKYSTYLLTYKTVEKLCVMCFKFRKMSPTRHVFLKH